MPDLSSSTLMYAVIALNELLRTAYQRVEAAPHHAKADADETALDIWKALCDARDAYDVMRNDDLQAGWPTTDILLAPYGGAADAAAPHN